MARRAPNPSAQSEVEQSSPSFRLQVQFGNGPANDWQPFYCYAILKPLDPPDPSAITDDPKPGWRNWQTQRTQNPPTFGSWGFDSPSRHQRLITLHLG